MEQNVFFSSEIDHHAGITYKANFGEKPAGDIRKIQSEDIPDHDILLAGFPCQPFSVAGEKKGLRDQRGNLFYEIVRVLEGCRPKAFLLENVKGLLSLNKGRTFALICEELSKRGYKIHAKVLNTMLYGGIPQTRERPDISASHLYKQMGNSVSVPVIERIAKKMIDVLKLEKHLFFNYNKKLAERQLEIQL